MDTNRLVQLYKSKACKLYDTWVNLFLLDEGEYKPEGYIEYWKFDSECNCITFLSDDGDTYTLYTIESMFSQN